MKMRETNSSCSFRIQPCGVELPKAVKLTVVASNGTVWMMPSEFILIHSYFVFALLLLFVLFYREEFRR